MTLQEQHSTTTAPLQRTSGEGRIRVNAQGGRSRLADLHQAGAAKIRLPRVTGSADAEAVLINTAGGLTGGDDMAWSATVGEGAGLTVTTQACEKVYKSVGGNARIATRLAVEDGGFLAWLPQETILYNKARLERSLDVEIAGDAELLLLETVVFGRQASGETCISGVFRDRWQVRHEGRLIHREDVVLEGGLGNLLARRAVAAGCAAQATVLMIGADVEGRLEPLRRALAEIDTVSAGASVWSVGGTGKLLARMQAVDSYELRKALVCTISVLNQRAPLPKVWSI